MIGENRVDDRVVRAALEGGIQVDDMQVAETEPGPRTGDGDRIRQAKPLLLEMLARETDAGTITQIQRGNYYHCVLPQWLRLIP